MENGDEEEGNDNFMLDMGFLETRLLRNRMTEDIMSLFQKIETNNLLTKENSLYNKIHSDTINIYSFLDDSIKNFHTLFEADLKNFEECLKHLEKIAIPNNCVCAGVIDDIPGWRCIDCSKYENAIYCNDCYIKSKDLHKDHKVVFLFSSGGMCDCGDPDSLITFCPEHSGPHEQKQINEYISKSFQNTVLNKINCFFDVLFSKFSKYFILTEKCDYFCKEIFDEKFGNHNLLDNNLKDELKDIIFLKNNFCIVFQNLLHFLRLISQKNLGMLYIIANYFLKNHFQNQKLENDYLTTHRCIKINENDIKLFNYDNKNHICECPFFRLFMSNYRDDIKSIKNENEEFILSFAHNLPLRRAYCILFFSLYKQVILNNNEDILFNRNQFFLEDVTELIAQKTNLLEEAYDTFYNYVFEKFKSPKAKNDFGLISDSFINSISYPVFYMKIDTKYLSKPKIRKLMTEKSSIMKRAIDCLCLIHNKNEFKSIVPHPQFQNKGYSSQLIELEFRFLNIIEEINMFIDWDKIEKLKEIFKYLINKILNQEKEGIKQLKEDEYSFHLGLYRCFGLFINAFCFNHSFNKNCSIIDSIKFFQKNFFESQKDVKQFIDIILNDYFKLFGFIAGIKNNFFNYYDTLIAYSNIYFLVKMAYIIDFSLLKYLFVMKNGSIDINDYLKKSNIENVFSSFENNFILEKNEKNQNNETKKIEDEKDIKNIDTNDNTNDNNEDVRTQEFNNNTLEFLQLLRTHLNRQIDPNIINQFMNNNNRNISKIEEKKRDEYYYIMQLRLLLDILIDFMKDDSCPYWNLMRSYEETISSKTKEDLYNVVRNNKNAMEDLENILKEKLIHEIIAQGNLADLKKITKNFDKYLLTLFEKDNKFNIILDELTYNKINGETKMFYLKDINLKYLDINYYFSYKDKSGAQRYILDFKKDIIKPYNNYYYNPSELTFEFYKTVYEKILLNKNNLELIIKIVKKLFSDEKITENLDTKSIRNSLLPVILNYLSMFSVINTKSFIEFKYQNKDSIDDLCKILSNSVKNNKGDILEKDLEENVKEVINQLNRYQIINDHFKSDLSKLNKYDYNTEFLEKINKNKSDESVNKNINSINIITGDNTNKDDKKKKISKDMKSKLKNLMKKKTDLFMNKISLNQEMVQAINEQNKNEEIVKDSNDEIMCFFCRNPIKLNSFEIPYGKIGLFIEDYFYINSIKATIRAELEKLTFKNIDKNDLYNKIIEYLYKDILSRIISCGHYFHTSCFLEGCSKHNNEFICPLCLKNQNILIPPLNRFHKKYSFLNTENLNELFNDKSNIKKGVSEKELKLFKTSVEGFLSKINFKTNKYKDYKLFLDFIYLYYKGYFNFLENIFYINSTTFHKQQQIDTLQNINLSLRFVTKNSDFDIKQIINYIKTELLKLIEGPNENEFIFKQKDTYMHYINLLEKILLSLLLLFDYEEIQKEIKYIIYIFLPYFSFGFYFRDLYMKKELNELDNFKFKEKMNINDFQNYLKDNNKQLLNYFNNFLKKFIIIKLISDFSNKNEDIINSFNELSIKNLMSLLGIENLFNFLPKDEFNLMDIINNLPKIFNPEDIFYKIFGNISNHNKIFNAIFTNIIKNNNEKDVYNYELIIQFSPIKFNFIYLDNNIFDWIEKNLGKKCDICNKKSKFSFICLICGNKVCHVRNNLYHILDHTKKCGGKYCIFVDMDNMKMYLWDSDNNTKKLFSLYVNEAGIGPKGSEISNKYNLSYEKLALSIKNYTCNDFHFN